MKTNSTQATPKLLLATFSVAIGFLFAAPEANSSTLTCQQIFERVESYGQLRPDFQHDTHYTKMVENQSRIMNQCSLGTCHLHAWLADIEHFGKRQITLSSHYLASSLWLGKAVETLHERSITELDLNLGMTPWESRKVVLALGLMPDSAWTNRRDFQDSKTADRLGEYARNIIANAKLAREKSVDQREKDIINAKAEMLLEDLFVNTVGMIPEKFMFEGVEYTPNTFQQTFYPELSRRIVNIRAGDSPITKTSISETQSATMIETSVARLEHYAREQIDKGNNVYFGYDHRWEYVDKDTGIMSISAFKAPIFGTPLSRRNRAQVGITRSGHAVEIVGYDLDPQTNRVKKWLIRNSWGEKSGDKGYYHMYADYFRQFATGITIFRDQLSELPRQRAPLPPRQLSLDLQPPVVTPKQ